MENPYVQEMQEIKGTYCDNHFTIFVSQVIMLCILNLHRVVCQEISIKREKTPQVEKITYMHLIHSDLIDDYNNLSLKYHSYMCSKHEVNIPTWNLSVVFLHTVSNVHILEIIFTQIIYSKSKH